MIAKKKLKKAFPFPLRFPAKTIFSFKINYRWPIKSFRFEPSNATASVHKKFYVGVHVF